MKTLSWETRIIVVLYKSHFFTILARLVFFKKSCRIQAIELANPIGEVVTEELTVFVKSFSKMFECGNILFRMSKIFNILYNIE